ncbi:MAG: hypothetical protein ACO3A2_00120 [Bdellovibrionia bacterium]
MQARVNRWTDCLGIGLSFFLWAGLSSSAWAYLPPSQYLVKNWVKQHAGAKTIRLKTKITGLREDGSPSAVHFSAWTLYSTESKKLKSWAVTDSGSELYAVEKDVSHLSLPTVLFFESDLKLVMQALADKQIPVRSESTLLEFKTEEERQAAEQEFLARWNGGFAWVIGNQESREEESPQLWIQKDSFLPVRLRFEDQAFEDVQISGYQLVRDFIYPRSLTLKSKYSGASLLEEVQEIKVNLDAAALKKNLKPGFSDLGQAQPGELKKLIQTYYQVLR